MYIDIYMCIYVQQIYVCIYIYAHMFIEKRALSGLGRQRSGRQRSETVSWVMRD